MNIGAFKTSVETGNRGALKKSAAKLLLCVAKQETNAHELKNNKETLHST